MPLGGPRRFSRSGAPAGLAFLLLAFAATSLAPVRSERWSPLSVRATIARRCPSGTHRGILMASTQTLNLERALLRVRSLTWTGLRVKERLKAPMSIGAENLPSDAAEQGSPAKRESLRGGSKRRGEGGRKMSYRRKGISIESNLSGREMLDKSSNRQLQNSSHASTYSRSSSEVDEHLKEQKENVIPEAPPIAVIQFRRGGRNESAIPDVKLAEAKDGSSRTATFVFEYPDIIKEFLRAPMDQVFFFEELHGSPKA